MGRKKLRKCLQKGCRRTEATGCRGLCRPCYQRLYRLVKRGEAAWPELVKAGYCEAASGDTSDSRALLAQIRQDVQRIRHAAHPGSPVKRGARSSQRSTCNA